MKIETHPSSQHVNVVLRGDFDTEAATEFLETVDQLGSAEGPRISVSFRYVKYLNSTALGAVVRARANCQNGGGDLVILRPSPLSRDVIVRMGLDGVLPMFDAEDAAIDYLTGKGKLEATKTAPVEAGGDQDKTVVMFSFDDQRSELFPGKAHHGVGTVASVDAKQIVIDWNPAEHGVDPSTASTMFATGSTMNLKLQIKLIRKEFFKTKAKITDLKTSPDGLTVTAAWSELVDADRKALEGYSQDLRLFRDEAGQA